MAIKAGKRTLMRVQTILPGMTDMLNTVRHNAGISKSAQRRHSTKLMRLDTDASIIDEIIEEEEDGPNQTEEQRRNIKRVKARNLRNLEKALKKNALKDALANRKMDFFLDEEKKLELEREAY